MKKNQKILNEAFFKKTSYYDNLKKKLPQYEPSDVRKEGQPGFGSILNQYKGGFPVTDTEEARKRLVGTLGASVGINSVKNIASRSVKSFPVVISDNLEPETIVMLKKLMEEQYAEYINLLISNQVVDISAFESGTDGNIAIQALDTISGTDFSKQGLAKKLSTGDIDTKEYFGSISPLYNLIRNESKEYKSGNALIDNLLEGAVIVPKEYKEDLVEFYKLYGNEMSLLNEFKPAATDRSREVADTPNSRDPVTLRDFLSKEGLISTPDPLKVQKSEEVFDKVRGYDAASDKYRKLLTPNVLVRPEELRKSLDSSIAELLLNPKNEVLRDKFEKATFLLQANRIAGSEYIEYLTQRLGIPVPKEVRAQIVTQFKISDIADPNMYNVGLGLNPLDIARINQNQSLVRRFVPSIFSLTGRDLLKLTLTGGAVTAGTFLGAAGLAGLTIGFATPLALIGSAVVGAIGGAGTVAVLLPRIFQRGSARRIALGRVQGWERVEALILSMEEQQKNLVGEKEDNQPENIEILSGGELQKELVEYNEDMEKVLTGVNPKAYFEENYDHKLDLKTLKDAIKLAEFNIDYIEDDQKPLLEKMIISTTEPIKVIKKYELDPSIEPEIMVTPDFMSRSTYAYGSVEYDRKELKDRKYNSPLIMTVTFKERYSDGKFSDNELVAVIGILGVITRVPSEEMEYILKSNAQGNTLKGFLQGDSSGENLVSNLLGVAKIKKDVENLEQSADVWNNLEKISRLAVSNKLTGRQNNNIANAHIVFSQKEIDNVKADTAVDYLKNKKLSESLMKRYSAFTLMIANDVSERLYIFDDPDNISWNVVPYATLKSKDTGDQLTSALIKMSRGR